MTEEYCALLVRLLTIHADAELASVQQLRPWLDTAPTVDDRWLLSRRVMEGLQHGWQVCKMLRGLGAEAEIEDLLARPLGKHTLAPFNESLDGWEDLVMYSFFIDRVGVYQLQEFRDSSYLPLARVIPKMLGEKVLHGNYGVNLLRRLCSDPPGRAEALVALGRWYPLALDMFGHTRSPRNERYRALGLKKRPNEATRKAYITEVSPLLEELGLVPPPEEAGRRVL